MIDIEPFPVKVLLKLFAVDKSIDAPAPLPKSEYVSLKVVDVVNPVVVKLVDRLTPVVATMFNDVGEVKLGVPPV